MKKFIPLFLTLGCILISTVLVLSTFIGSSWLEVKSSLDLFGLWTVCLKGSSNCYLWYDDGQTQANYQISSEPYFGNSFKNFIIVNIFINRQIYCFPSFSMCLHLLDYFGDRFYFYKHHIS
jgi:hypothetical protein